MKCDEYETLITEYLENTASPSQQIQMESHLAECSKCRELAALEKSVMEQLRAIPIVPCPDEVVDRVMESISDRGMSLKERIRNWFQPEGQMRYGIASLAGSFVVVMLLLLIYFPGQKNQTLEVQKYSPEEIQQATVEAKLAIAYFSVYAQKAETVLEGVDFTEPVMKPLEGELKKALGKIPYI